MRKIIVLFVTAFVCICISCKNNDIKIDWTGEGYFLDGFNENYVQFCDNVSMLKVYNNEKSVNYIRMYEHGRITKTIYLSREENYSERFYDENWQNVIETRFFVEDKKINNIHYSYDYDKNEREKIITLTDENGLRTVFKELRKKTGIYECEISYEKKTENSSEKTYEHKTAKLDGKKIVEFSSDKKPSLPFYKFEYEGKLLKSMKRYIEKSRHLVRSYSYEYEKGILSDVICKRYDKKTGKENVVYSIYFSDFDSHGNWRRAERVYGKNDSTITHREIVYDDEIVK